MKKLHGDSQNFGGKIAKKGLGVNEIEASKRH
jgi:hypothetical protein